MNSAGLPKSETQLKLDKIKERKKMLEEAEKEKHEKSGGGRHTHCHASHEAHLGNSESLQNISHLYVAGAPMSKKSSVGSRAQTAVSGRK